MTTVTIEAVVAKQAELAKMIEAICSKPRTAILAYSGRQRIATTTEPIWQTY